MTQSKPTNFHVFLTSKVLAAAESIADWMEVTPAEKSKLEAADAVWERPPQAFIDMWIERGKFVRGQISGYNESTGFFELNGLTDITFKEAIDIMAASYPKYFQIKIGSDEYGPSYTHVYPTCRTLFPTCTAGFTTEYTASFQYCGSLEVIRFINGYNSGSIRVKLSNTFALCSKLKRVIGNLQLASNVQAYTFDGCNELVEINFVLGDNAVTSVNMSGCPKWGYDSVKFTINYKTSTKEVNIPVHQQVYAKLTGEGDYSDGNGTREEWMQLYQDALEKQITFASAN